MMTAFVVMLLSPLWLISKASAATEVGKFVLSDGSMDWFDGEEWCKAQYGDTGSLATITNDEDAQILLDWATAGIDAWIGLYNEYGDWEWESGYSWFVWMCSV